MNDATSNLTEQQVAAALSVQATAAGAAELLTQWLERTVTPGQVMQAILASPWLERVAAFCAEAQGRARVVNVEERIRVMTGALRWRDRRARK